MKTIININKTTVGCILTEAGASWVNQADTDRKKEYKKGDNYTTSFDYFLYLTGSLIQLQNEAFCLNPIWIDEKN